MSKFVDYIVGAEEKKPPRTEISLWLCRPGMRTLER